MKTLSTNTIGSIGFVAALLTVGLLSHGPFRSAISLAAIANGSLQAGYEDQFEQSNPLQNISISTIAAIKYLAQFTNRMLSWHVLFQIRGIGRLWITNSFRIGYLG